MNAREEVFRSLCQTQQEMLHEYEAAAMTFDANKLNHARDAFKLIAALCFNDFEPTPYQLDTAVEMFKTWAEQERLVADHLRRVA